MDKLRLKPRGSMGFDRTTPYDVIIDERVTLREFLHLIEKRSEWGRIDVINGDTSCRVCFLYTRNVDATFFSDDWLERYVVDASAFGWGCSNMGYILNIEKGE